MKWRPTTELPPDRLISTKEEIKELLIVFRNEVRFGHYGLFYGWRLAGSPSQWTTDEITDWMPKPNPPRRRSE